MPTTAVIVSTMFLSAFMLEGWPWFGEMSQPALLIGGVTQAWYQELHRRLIIVIRSVHNRGDTLQVFGIFGQVCKDIQS